VTEDNQLRKMHIIHKLMYHWLEQKCTCAANKPCERCFILEEAMKVFPTETSTVVNIRYNEIGRFN